MSGCQLLAWFRREVPGPQADSLYTSNRPVESRRNRGLLRWVSRYPPHPPRLRHSGRPHEFLNNAWLRPRHGRLPLRCAARTRQHRSSASRCFARLGTLRPRFWTATWQPQHPWRSRPAAPCALHGRHVHGPSRTRRTACYQRLVADGKPHKVAMVAIMRKLACLLTALLREDRCWQAEPPPSRELEAAA